MLQLVFHPVDPYVVAINTVHFIKYSIRMDIQHVQPDSANQLENGNQLLPSQGHSLQNVNMWMVSRGGDSHPGTRNPHCG